MNREEVTQKVHNAVIETFSLKEPIQDDNLSFKDDLKADSIDVVSLLLLLEEEFSEDVDEDAAENFKTISDVIDYIMEKLANENSLPSE